jgi:predicted nucleic acid-binding protein
LWTNVELEAFARKAEIAAYDAAYLALALRRDIPLATIDELLKRKALEYGIEVLL